MEQTKVLVVDLLDAFGTGDAVRRVLSFPGDRREGIQQKFLFLGKHSNDSVDVAAAIAGFHPHLMLLITSSEVSSSAASVIRHASRNRPDVPVVVVGNELSPSGMMELLQLGAADYVTVPVKAIELLPRIWRLTRRRTQAEQVTRKLLGKLGLEMIVGSSEVFLSEVRKIPIVAMCDACVLIIGETGTGKELCARAVHYLSPRSSHPFVAVSCGAIPPELIENELFGHNRGAFTGAHAYQPGLIAEAEGGTLFLDDVESLPLSSQAKFLRFLQEKEYRRLGSTRTLMADVRVVAATNVDPEGAARLGSLRRDLLYRLNVVSLALPPLRDRKNDILLLARHFLEKYAFEFRKKVLSFSDEALDALASYDWPGNVRELENVVQRAVLFTSGAVALAEQIILPQTIVSSAPNLQMSFKEEKTKLIKRFEKDYIEELLRQHGGNITQAARAAKKNRRAFWELIRKYDINVGGFASGSPGTEQDKNSLKQDNIILSAVA